MWWKVILVVILLTLVMAIVGVYAGAALFYGLTQVDPMHATWHTLLDASKSKQLTDKQLMFLPWCWCLAAGIALLPIGISLMAFFGRYKEVSDLHGNARFANAKELRLFKYDGEYK